MKNIYLLPTDKPSRLQRFTDVDKIEFELASKDEFFNKGMNIYITSNEEIKEGIDQWYLDKVLNEPYNSGGAQYSSKQDVIILTTDQDLIKDGVQAIDDEFLEWFVKNPSCKKVEVEEFEPIYGHQNNSSSVLYKIIIPKEEPKERLKKVLGLKHPKQEKLEETIGLKAHEYSMQYVGTDKYTVSMLAIEFGYHLALEQEQEKSYSEEDMHNLMDEYQNWLFNTNTVVLTFREWFKQFKKK
jgi:hypothetical protein